MPIAAKRINGPKNSANRSQLFVEIQRLKNQRQQEQIAANRAAKMLKYVPSRGLTNRACVENDMIMTEPSAVP